MAGESPFLRLHQSLRLRRILRNFDLIGVQLGSDLLDLLNVLGQDLPIAIDFDQQQRPRILSAGRGEDNLPRTGSTNCP